MSEFTDIRDEVENEFSKVVSWMSGSDLGKQLQGDIDAALSELESIAPADLEEAVKTIGVASLEGLTGGVQGAIASGIAAAPAAFLAAGKDISEKTIATLATSVANSLSADGVVGIPVPQVEEPLNPVA